MLSIGKRSRSLMHRQPIADWLRARRLCAPVLFGAAVLCAGGCRQDLPDGAKSDAGVTQRAERGPVTLALTVIPETLDASQHALVVVEVSAERGVTVHKSEYGHSLTEGDRRFEYRIVDSHRRQAVSAGDGRLQWRYEFEIEFLLPGEYELPPAVVSFVDTRAAVDEGDAAVLDADAEAQTLTTQPITVAVRQPAAAPLTPEELRQITRLDPLELPREWPRWWWLALIIVILVIVVVVFLVARRLRRLRSETVIRIPAHEWARQQIAALLAEDLIAKGRVQEFYYRISGIVRGYIERRFGVRAPEMTTEEFLAAAPRDARIGQGMALELDRFLSACDLVKYARHEPGPGEADLVLRAARDFVERTRERAKPTDIDVIDRSPAEERAA